MTKLVSKRWWAGAAAVLGSVTIAATPGLAQKAPAATLKGDWNRVVTVNADGHHVLGNPDAKVKLTEFVSYTCSHCADFEAESAAALKLSFVAGGKGSVEIRHFVRDPVDMVVSLLADCGPKEKFPANHSMFMRSQAKWMEPLKNLSPTLRTRWSTPDFATRARYIASDLGFYPMMATRGYTRPQVDVCLADKASAARLAAATDQAQKELSVEGTPTFAIDGVTLAGTHSWELLQPQLAARVK